MAVSGKRRAWWAVEQDSPGAALGADAQQLELDPATEVHPVEFVGPDGDVGQFAVRGSSVNACGQCHGCSSRCRCADRGCGRAAGAKDIDVRGAPGPRDCSLETNRSW